MELIKNLIDPVTIITTVGLFGIITIIFAESGVFFGFFFPGDSLLFTAGIFAARGDLPLTGLLVGCAVAAILGDSFGYFFGKKAGIALFAREDSKFFKKKHVHRAQHFYEKHGTKTIVLARFIPIVRTFAPIVAGIGNMKYSTFVAYNIAGGILWTVAITLLGYFLGNSIPNIDHYLLPIIIGIILVSMIPIAVEYRRAQRG